MDILASMDTGKGSFVELDSQVAADGADKGLKYFQVGQFLEINGSRFVVEKIGRKQLRLKLLERV